MGATLSLRSGSREACGGGGVQAPQGVTVEDERKTTMASGLEARAGSPYAAMF